jgi:hypothetical protein
MREQTGEQYRSVEVPGKLQNCGEFGTYEPAMSTKAYQVLCHGGHYQGEYYLPCPVRDQCRIATLRKKDQPSPAAQPAQQQTQQPWRGPGFKIPDLGRLPTQMPPNAAQAAAQAKARVGAAVDAAAAAAGPQWPGTVIPPKDAPPGMRTPHIGTSFTGDVSPTFLPEEGQSTFERLLLNILQGLIAAIGWHIWNFCRSVDLFA